MLRTVGIVSRWEGIDFLIWFIDLAWVPVNEMENVHKMIDGIMAESRGALKPMAIVAQTDISPEQIKKVGSFLEKCVSSELPVYYSFGTAANALHLVVSHNERRLGKEADH